MRITLEAARVNAKLKQTEAAELIGVRKETLSSWERGKTFPKADKIPVICATYKCSIDDIQWTR